MSRLDGFFPVLVESPPFLFQQDFCTQSEERGSAIHGVLNSLDFIDAALGSAIVIFIQDRIPNGVNVMCETIYKTIDVGYTKGVGRFHPLIEIINMMGGKDRLEITDQVV